jgi:hypothetical protein
MERTNRIQQLYGYVVCLIAVITFLIAASSLVNAVFDLMRPQNTMMYGPEAASYEAYKLDRQERVASVQQRGGPQVAIPPDSELRRSYEDQRRAREETARWQATKSIVTSGIMLCIAAMLFATHWRWVRRIAEREGTATPPTSFSSPPPSSHG